jgi:ELWxxDGT repeat protein
MALKSLIYAILLAIRLSLCLLPIYAQNNQYHDHYFMYEDTIYPYPLHRAISLPENLLSDSSRLVGVRARIDNEFGDLYLPLPSNYSHSDSDRSKKIQILFEKDLPSYELSFITSLSDLQDLSLMIRPPADWNSAKINGRGQKAVDSIQRLWIKKKYDSHSYRLSVKTTSNDDAQNSSFIMQFDCTAVFPWSSSTNQSLIERSIAINISDAVFITRIDEMVSECYQQIMGLHGTSLSSPILRVEVSSLPSYAYDTGREEEAMADNAAHRQSVISTWLISIHSTNCYLSSRSNLFRVGNTTSNVLVEIKSDSSSNSANGRHSLNLRYGDFITTSLDVQSLRADAIKAVLSNLPPINVVDVIAVTACKSSCSGQNYEHTCSCGVDEYQLVFRHQAHWNSTGTITSLTNQEAFGEFTLALDAVSFDSDIYDMKIAVDQAGSVAELLSVSLTVYELVNTSNVLNSTSITIAVLPIFDLPILQSSSSELSLSPGHADVPLPLITILDVDVSDELFNLSLSSSAQLKIDHYTLSLENDPILGGDGRYTFTAHGTCTALSAILDSISISSLQPRARPNADGEILLMLSSIRLDYSSALRLKLSYQNIFSSLTHSYQLVRESSTIYASYETGIALPKVSLLVQGLIDDPILTLRILSNESSTIIYVPILYDISDDEEYFPINWYNSSILVSLSAPSTIIQAILLYLRVSTIKPTSLIFQITSLSFPELLTVAVDVDYVRPIGLGQSTSVPAPNLTALAIRQEKEALRIFINQSALAAVISYPVSLQQFIDVIGGSAKDIVNISIICLLGNFSNHQRHYSYLVSLSALRQSLQSIRYIPPASFYGNDILSLRIEYYAEANHSMSTMIKELKLSIDTPSQLQLRCQLDVNYSSSSAPELFLSTFCSLTIRSKYLGSSTSEIIQIEMQASAGKILMAANISSYCVDLLHLNDSAVSLWVYAHKLKNLFDRLSYEMNDPRYMNTYAYISIVASIPSAPETLPVSSRVRLSSIQPSDQSPIHIHVQQLQQKEGGGITCDSRYQSYCPTETTSLRFHLNQGSELRLDFLSFADMMPLSAAVIEDGRSFVEVIVSSQQGSFSRQSLNDRSYANLDELEVVDDGSNSQSLHLISTSLSMLSTAIQSFELVYPLVNKNSSSSVLIYHDEVSVHILSHHFVRVSKDVLAEPNSFMSDMNIRLEVLVNPLPRIYEVKSSLGSILGKEDESLELGRYLIIAYDNHQDQHEEWYRIHIATSDGSLIISSHNSRRVAIKYNEDGSSNIDLYGRIHDLNATLTNLVFQGNHNRAYFASILFTSYILDTAANLTSSPGRYISSRNVSVFLEPVDDAPMMEVSAVKASIVQAQWSKLSIINISIAIPDAEYAPSYLQPIFQEVSLMVHCDNACKFRIDSTYLAFLQNQYPTLQVYGADLHDLIQGVIMQGDAASILAAYHSIFLLPLSAAASSLELFLQLSSKHNGLSSPIRNLSFDIVDWMSLSKPSAKYLTSLGNSASIDEDLSIEDERLRCFEGDDCLVMTSPIIPPSNETVTSAVKIANQAPRIDSSRSPWPILTVLSTDSFTQIFHDDDETNSLIFDEDASSADLFSLTMSCEHCRFSHDSLIPIQDANRLAVHVQYRLITRTLLGIRYAPLTGYTGFDRIVMRISDDHNASTSSDLLVYVKFYPAVPVLTAYAPDNGIIRVNTNQSSGFHLFQMMNTSLSSSSPPSTRYELSLSAHPKSILAVDELLFYEPMQLYRYLLTIYRNDSRVSFELELPFDNPPCRTAHSIELGYYSSIDAMLEAIVAELRNSDCLSLPKNQISLTIDRKGIIVSDQVGYAQLSFTSPSAFYMRTSLSTIMGGISTLRRLHSTTVFSPTDLRFQIYCKASHKIQSFSMDEDVAVLEDQISNFLDGDVQVTQQLDPENREVSLVMTYFPPARALSLIGCQVGLDGAINQQISAQIISRAVSGGIPIIYELRSSATAVDPIDEISFLLSPKLHQSQSSFFINLTIESSSSNTNYLYLGPIYPSTFPMTADEDLHAQVGGRANESMQSLFRNLPRFLDDYCDDVQVTKSVELVELDGKSVINTTFRITYLHANEYSYKLKIFPPSTSGYAYRRIRDANLVAGRFSLSWAGYSTPFLASNISQESLQAALLQLSSIAHGKIGELVVRRQGPDRVGGHLWNIYLLQKASLLETRFTVDSHEIRGLGATLSVNCLNCDKHHLALFILQGGNIQGIEFLPSMDEEISVFDPQAILRVAGSIDALNHVLNAVQIKPPNRYYRGLIDITMQVTSTELSADSLAAEASFSLSYQNILANEELYEANLSVRLIWRGTSLSTSPSIDDQIVVYEDSELRLGFDSFITDDQTHLIGAHTILTPDIQSKNSSGLVIQGDERAICSLTITSDRSMILNANYSTVSDSITGEIRYLNEAMSSYRYRACHGCSGIDHTHVQVDCLGMEASIQGIIPVMIVPIDQTIQISWKEEVAMDSFLMNESVAVAAAIFESQDDAIVAIGNQLSFVEFTDDIFLETVVVVDQGTLSIQDLGNAFIERETSYSASQRRITISGLGHELAQALQSLTYTANPISSSSSPVRYDLLDLSIRAWNISLYAIIECRYTSYSYPRLELPEHAVLKVYEDSSGVIGTDCCNWLDDMSYAYAGAVQNLSSKSISIIDLEDGLASSGRFIIRNSFNSSYRDPLTNDFAFNLTYSSHNRSDYDLLVFDTKPSFAVRLSVSYGTMSILRDPIEGINLIIGDGFQDHEVMFNGSINAINLALSGLIYQPDENWNSYRNPDNITLDHLLGNVTSATGYQQLIDIPIFVYPINDAPVISTTISSMNPILCQSNLNCRFLGKDILIRDVDLLEYESDSYMMIQVSASYGVLSLAHQTSSNISIRVPGNQIATILHELAYLPCPNFVGKDILLLTVHDRGNHGRCSALSTTEDICDLHDQIALPIIVSSLLPQQMRIRSPTLVQGVEDVAILLHDLLISTLLRYPSIDVAAFCSSFSYANDVPSSSNFSLRLSSSTGWITIAQPLRGACSWIVGDGILKSELSITCSDLYHLNQSLSGPISFLPLTNRNYLNSESIAMQIEVMRDTDIATSRITFSVTPVNDAPKILAPALFVVDDLNRCNLGSILIEDLDSEDYYRYAYAIASLQLEVSHGSFQTNNRSLLPILSPILRKNSNRLQLSATNSDFIELNEWLSSLEYEYHGDDLAHGVIDQLIVSARDACDSKACSILVNKTIPIIREQARPLALSIHLPKNHPLITYQDIAIPMTVPGNQILLKASDPTSILQLTIKVLYGYLILDDNDDKVFARDQQLHRKGDAEDLNLFLRRLLYVPPLGWNSLRAGRVDELSLSLFDLDVKTTAYATIPIIVYPSERSFYYINLPNATYVASPCLKTTEEEKAQVPSPLTRVCKQLVAVSAYNVTEDTATIIAEVIIDSLEARPEDVVLAEARIYNLSVSSNHGNLSLNSVSSTIANLNHLLRSLTYTPDSDYYGNDSVSFILADQLDPSGLVYQASLPILIQPVADDPKILAPSMLYGIEDELLHLSELQLVDYDHLPSQSLFAVNISVLFGQILLLPLLDADLVIVNSSIRSDDEALPAVASQSWYHSLQFIAPLATMNKALASILLLSRHHWNSELYAALDMLEVKASCLVTNTSTRHIIGILVQPQNDPAEIRWERNSTSPIIVTQGDPYKLNGISIRDVDHLDGVHPIEVSLTSVHGSLTFALADDDLLQLIISNSTNDTTADILTISLTGPLNLINQALASLIFTASYSLHASASLSIKVIAGIQLTIAFDLRPKNRAPVILLPQDFHSRQSSSDALSVDEASFIRIQGAYRNLDLNQTSSSARTAIGYELYVIEINPHQQQASLNAFPYAIQAADLNPGIASSHPQHFTRYRDQEIIFQASDALHGAELWTLSMDSSQTARLLFDLLPGLESSTPQSLHVHDEVLYFSADGVDTFWMPIPDHRDACDSFRQSSYHPDIYYAVADTNTWQPTRRYDCPSGYHWITTAEAISLYPPTLDASLYGMKKTYQDECGWSGLVYGHQQRRYFRFADSYRTRAFKDAAKPDAHRIEYDISVDTYQIAEFAGIVCRRDAVLKPRLNQHKLWRSDGSPMGTYRLESSLDDPQDLVSIGQHLYFTALPSIATSLYEREIYRTTGCIECAVRVSIASSALQPMYLTAVDNDLLFSAQSLHHGRELYRLRPDVDDDLLLIDLAPGSSSSNPQELIGPALSTSSSTYPVYFQAYEPTTGAELYVSDGSVSGSRLLKDICPGARSSHPRHFTWYQQLLYFQADDCIHGVELWRSDGTSLGTELVIDLQPGSGSSCPHSLGLVAMRSSLFFLTSMHPDCDASTSFSGQQKLWCSDGSAAGTSLVIDEELPSLWFDIPASTSASSIFYTDEGSLFFSAKRSSERSSAPIGAVEPTIATCRSQAIVVHDPDHLPFSLRIQASAGYLVLRASNSASAIMERCSSNRSSVLLIGYRDIDAIYLFNAFLGYDYQAHIILADDADAIDLEALAPSYALINIPAVGWEDGIRALRHWKTKLSSSSSSCSLIATLRSDQQQDDNLIRSVVEAGADTYLFLADQRSIPAAEQSILQYSSPLTATSRGSIEKANNQALFASMVREILALQPSHSCPDATGLSLQVLDHVTEQDLAQAMIEDAFKVLLPQTQRVVGSDILIIGTAEQINAYTEELYYYAPPGSQQRDDRIVFTATDGLQALCLQQAIEQETAVIAFAPYSTLSSPYSGKNSRCDLSSLMMTRSIEIFIVSTNQAPVLTLATEEIRAAAGQLIFLPAINITDDPYVVHDFLSPPPISLLMHCKIGRLSLLQLEGLAMTQGSGRNDQVLGLRGPIDTLTKNIQQLKYECRLIDGCVAGDEDTIVLIVDDEGFQGKGGPMQTTASILVHIV